MYKTEDLSEALTLHYQSAVEAARRGDDGGVMRLILEAEVVINYMEVDGILRRFPFAKKDFEGEKARLIRVERDCKEILHVVNDYSGRKQK